jgi:hypothetical protein
LRPRPYPAPSHEPRARCGRVRPSSVNAIAVGATVGEQLNGSTSFNAVLLVTFGLLRVAAFTLVYNGMLSISVIIENPLGTDEADFPARAYQAAMRAECEAFAIAVDAVPSWPGLGVDA